MLYFAINFTPVKEEVSFVIANFKPSIQRHNCASTHAHASAQPNTPSHIFNARAAWPMYALPTLQTLLHSVTFIVCKGGRVYFFELCKKFCTA